MAEITNITLKAGDYVVVTHVECHDDPQDRSKVTGYATEIERTDKKGRTRIAYLKPGEETQRAYSFDRSPKVDPVRFGSKIPGQKVRTMP